LSLVMPGYTAKNYCSENLASGRGRSRPLGYIWSGTFYAFLETDLQEGYLKSRSVCTVTHAYAVVATYYKLQSDNL